ncbi:MAG: hypothetical protein OMOMHJEC_02689 [Xanthomonadales bacterium]|nr:hypothetical protein [Xanthomonadales bacterium]
MPAHAAGSGASSLRPSSTKRTRPLCAHSTRQAAVTPRAPPETTTTSPSPITGASGCAGCATLRSVRRRPSAPSATSISPPPPSSSSAMACASASTLRPPRSISIAFSAACGHSSAAVLTSAGRPAAHARRSSPASRPKQPPLSCAVTNSRGAPCASWRAAANTSWFKAIAASRSANSRRPPRWIAASASAGSRSTAQASTPRDCSSAASAGASVSCPSTCSVPPPSRPGSARPVGGAGIRVSS